jgi:hypothetical protein
VIRSSLSVLRGGTCRLAIVSWIGANAVAALPALDPACTKNGAVDGEVVDVSCGAGEKRLPRADATGGRSARN